MMLRGKQCPLSMLTTMIMTVAIRMMDDGSDKYFHHCYELVCE